MRDSATAHPIPEPLVPPLDNNRRLIGLISRATGEGPDAVRQKLYREETAPGGGIREEMKRRGITPYVWSDELAAFYDENDSFLYGSIVWNRKPAKLAMRAWIAKYLAAMGPQRVLAFGDGPGFDSLHLALCGHDVTYFDVSRFDVAFARQISALSDAPVRVLENTAGIAEGAYDAITCLDVLEHVPEPSQLVEHFSRLLRPGGRLIVSAPFFLVSPDFLTHLNANRRYSGSLWRLYGRHGFALVDGRMDWGPLVLVKKPADPGSPSCGAARMLGLRLMGLVLAGARFWCAPYGWIAKKTAGRDAPRLDGLRNRK